jgi:ribosome-binding factor A
MESKRQQKLARLIQRDIGPLFQTDFRDLVGNAMVTVTKVMMSPDLKLAKVYLSFLGTQKEASVLADIVDHTPKIRYELGKKIRNQVRAIPELRFYLDDTSEYASHIHKVLKDLDIPKAEDEDDESSEEDQNDNK